MASLTRLGRFDAAAAEAEEANRRVDWETAALTALRGTRHAITVSRRALRGIGVREKYNEKRRGIYERVLQVCEICCRVTVQISSPNFAALKFIIDKLQNSYTLGRTILYLA